MIERAHGRGYHELVIAELTDYLRANPGAFDLVISADTFVYFGPLESVAAATCAALRPGGWFAFSVERLDDGDGDHRLDTSGRYRHSRAYVRRVLLESGFTAANFREAPLRTEGGTPVIGWLVVTRSCAAGSAPLI